MEDIKDSEVPEAQCMGTSGYLLSYNCVIHLARALGIAAGKALAASKVYQEMHAQCHLMTDKVPYLSFLAFFLSFIACGFLLFLSDGCGEVLTPVVHFVCLKNGLLQRCSRCRTL